MVLTNDEVIDLIKSGVSKEILSSRKKARKNNMHITGLRVKEYLEKLDDYETYAQKNLREKLVKSNRSTFSFILRPTDQIFTAKGGSIVYNLPQERIDALKMGLVADGLDIKRYLKKVVKKKYVIDPNGVLFVDLDENGKIETHVVMTREIFWYKNKGNVVDAIIFEGQKREGEENKGKLFYRVIDSETDRIFVKENGEVSILASETLDNYFGYVPALIMGDEKNPNEEIFESIISDILDDADEMLRDQSVDIVHKLSHAYPIYWAYAQACTRCEGEGEIILSVDETQDPPVIEKDKCPSCGGDGAKKRSSASDQIVLDQPGEGEPTIAPNVAGFVQPDLGTMKFYKEMLTDSRNRMFKAMWGTTNEGSGKRETATGRFLDVQPVQNRLMDISYTFSRMHKFLLDTYGKAILRDPSYESSVNYGTRYFLEGPDDILDKLVEVSREKVPDSVKLDLTFRYYEAEYQNDPMTLAKKVKLSKVDPFPTLSTADVLNSTTIPEEDQLKKIYLGEWANSLTEAEILMMTVDQLRDSLTNYVTNKQLNINTNE